MALLGDPRMMQGLLGPMAIRQAAQQRVAQMTPRSAGGRMGEPSPIITQGDDIGAGLAGLGEGVAAVGGAVKAKKQEDAQRATLEKALGIGSGGAAKAIPNPFGLAREPMQLIRAAYDAGDYAGGYAALSSAITGGKKAEYVNAYNPDTEKIITIEKGAQPPKGFALMGDAEPRTRADWEKQYDMALKQGYTGGVVDFIRDTRASRNNVTINSGATGPQIGTIPPGFQAVRDVGPDGKETISMSAIPGGPADIKAQEQADKAEQRQGQANRQFDVVQEDIGRAINLINSDGLPTTGLIGSVASAIPGTDAFSLGELLKGLEANISFNRLNEMRQSSPTGGALGNVTERELSLLGAVYGSVRQANSAEELMFNLRRLSDLFDQIVHRGIDGESGGAGDGDSNIDALLEKYKD